MEYIYAALLLHKLGKEINEENLKKVIEAAGGSADEARAKSVVASLKGVNIDQALKEAADITNSHCSSAGSGKARGKERRKA